MANTVFILAALLCALGATHAQKVDRTRQERAFGSDVVQVAVNRITAVFGDDSMFLRRIAYVESKDGTDPNTYRNNYYGGIWQVDKNGFKSTQDIVSHSKLKGKHQQILQNFGINWSNVQYRDLLKPLYSGIAARLYISNIKPPIPCDISGQARYWKVHYNTIHGAGTEQKFINDVQSLNQKQGCKVNSDVMFVLDTSGSIGSSNFEQVRQFIIQFIGRIAIGPMDNQVGVILFESSSTLFFDLDRYRDMTSLLNAVRHIPYTEGGTNIPAGLCSLYNVYSSNYTKARMDNSVFRIAILMTDGKSNENYNPCGFNSVLEAARAVHSLSPPVLIFAFGVGSEFSTSDLKEIASGPEFISSALSFSTTQLDCVQAVQEDNLCYRLSTPVELGSVTNGSLQQGEQIRWQFKVPQCGATFSLTVNTGKVEMYASTQTTAPNNAFYEWKIATSSNSHVRITPAAAVASDPNATVPVYLTLNGIEELNNFILRSDSTKAKGTTIWLLLVIAAFASHLTALLM